MNLVLDFNPDPENGGKWKRVTVAQSREMKQHLGITGGTESVSNKELEDLLSCK